MSSREFPTDMNHLFWDADSKALDLDRHKRYIIERVLELGTGDELKWLFEVYGASQVREVVCTSARLSRRTARCWANIFGLGEEEMRCFGTYSMNPDGYY